jgi:hypothetical protein
MHPWLLTLYLKYIVRNLTQGVFEKSWTPPIQNELPGEGSACQIMVASRKIGEISRLPPNAEILNGKGKEARQQIQEKAD